ncbi:hypothetical protein L9F63_015636 [Diploptera punctata]|uniref:FGFR1 oncogene partner (FOP) N-terminal dimerisation domain-containing protein n=1 Tax=Diploptera punctata TaxID=6984 RepID=A0AAD8EKB3_DIPPU|nr:hypothetical protein L9F63_015636 [Diploptera punctata]
MSEEEVELRDLVAQTLENNGILAKIRAELRAGVFLALEEQECVMDSDQYTNKPLKAFLSTTEGSIVACLVREFLEFFKLDFTLSVFDPETSHGKYYNYGGRSKLMKDLHLENTNGKKGPLLPLVAEIDLVVKDQHQEAYQLEVASNFSDGGKMNAARYLEALSPNTMLLDTTPPSNTRSEKILIPQTVTTLKDKTNSSFETKLLSSSPEVNAKHSIETTVIPKLKDINILSSVEGEPSPRSFSASDREEVSKEISKSKSESSGAAPCNSPLLEKSEKSSHSKQTISNSESAQHTDKSNSKKEQPPQHNKPSIESTIKTTSNSMSCLSNLPPLTGVGFPTKQAASALPAINKQRDMHQIKEIINLGLETHDNNYDEDFNSTASASMKENPTHPGTDSEIEEELGSGVDDLLNSASAVDDLTADVTISKSTNAADYMEDV